MVTYYVYFEEDEDNELETEVLVAADKTDDKDICKEIKDTLDLDFLPIISSREVEEDGTHLGLTRPVVKHFIHFQEKPEEKFQRNVPVHISSDNKKLGAFLREALDLPFTPEILEKSEEGENVSTVLKVPIYPHEISFQEKAEENANFMIPADVSHDERKLAKFLDNKMDLGYLPEIISKTQDEKDEVKVVLGKPQVAYVIYFEDTPGYKFNYLIPKDLCNNEKKLVAFIEQKMALKYVPIIVSSEEQPNKEVLTVLRKPEIAHIITFEDSPTIEHKLDVPVDKTEEELCEYVKEKLELDFLPIIASKSEQYNGEVVVKFKKPLEEYFISFEENPKEKFKVELACNHPKDYSSLAQSFKKKLDLPYLPVVISSSFIKEGQREALLRKPEETYLVYFEKQPETKHVFQISSIYKNQEKLAQYLRGKLSILYTPKILSNERVDKQYDGKGIDYETVLGVETIKYQVNFLDDPSVGNNTLDIPEDKCVNKYALADYLKVYYSLPYTPIVATQEKNEEYEIVEASVRSPAIQHEVYYKDSASKKYNFAIPADISNNPQLLSEFLKLKTSVPFFPMIVSSERKEKNGETVVELVLDKPLIDCDITFEDLLETPRKTKVPADLLSQTPRLCETIKKDLHLTFMPEVVDIIHDHHKNYSEIKLRKPKIPFTVSYEHNPTKSEIFYLTVDSLENDDNLANQIRKEMNLLSVPQIISKEKDNHVVIRKDFVSSSVGFEDSPNKDLYLIPGETLSDKRELAKYLKENMVLNFVPLITSVEPKQDNSVEIHLDYPLIKHSVYKRESGNDNSLGIVHIDANKAFGRRETLLQEVKRNLSLSYDPLFVSNDKESDASYRLVITSPDSQIFEDLIDEEPSKYFNRKESLKSNDDLFSSRDQNLSSRDRNKTIPCRIYFKNDPKKLNVEIPGKTLESRVLLADFIEEKLSLSYSPEISEIVDNSYGGKDIVLSEPCASAHITSNDDPQLKSDVKIPFRILKDTPELSSFLKDRLNLSYHPEILSNEKGTYKDSVDLVIGIPKTTHSIIFEDDPKRNSKISCPQYFVEPKLRRDQFSLYLKQKLSLDYIPSISSCEKTGEGAYRTVLKGESNLKNYVIKIYSDPSFQKTLKLSPNLSDMNLESEIGRALRLSSPPTILSRTLGYNAEEVTISIQENQPKSRNKYNNIDEEELIEENNVYHSNRNESNRPKEINPPKSARNSYIEKEYLPGDSSRNKKIVYHIHHYDQNADKHTYHHSTKNRYVDYTRDRSSPSSSHRHSSHHHSSDRHHHSSRSHRSHRERSSGHSSKSYLDKFATTYIAKDNRALVCEGKLKTTDGTSVYCCLYDDIFLITRNDDERSNFEILSFIKFVPGAQVRVSHSYENAFRITSGSQSKVFIASSKKTVKTWIELIEKVLNEQFGFDTYEKDDDHHYHKKSRKHNNHK